MNDQLLKGLRDGGFPQPPQQPQISIFDLVNMRIGLAQVEKPSANLATAIGHLDNVILNFTSSLSHKGN